MPDTFVKAAYPMVTPRAFFASTALQFDNEIPSNIQGQNCKEPLGAFRFGLIAGGIDAQSNITSAAELFGPVISEPNPSNQPTVLYDLGFVSSASMTTPRVMHQATLLASSFATLSSCSSPVDPTQEISCFSFSSQALITGGSQNLSAKSHSISALSSAEVFTFTASWPSNSRTMGQFAAAGNMKQARTLHQATLLADGSVLVTGGLSNKRKVLASAEIYDPIKKKFQLTKGTMRYARFGHTATLLSDGTVLIAGGASNAAEYPNLTGQSAISSAEIYNPASDRFTELAPMNVARAGHTASLVACASSQNCPVLIAGGINSQGVTASAELYTPGGSFSRVGDMTTPRFLHIAAPIASGSGQILIAGGASDANLQTALNTAERFDPIAKVFVATKEPMFAARRNFAAGTPTLPLYLSDFVILGGGDNSSGDAQGSAEFYLPPP
ncbi:MAG: Kelch repeat-containing protein [Candidatus Binataceae bacterium]